MADESDGPAFTPVNPYALARNEATAAQIKRFFTEATAEPADNGFQIRFDGREARTPARAPIVLPTEAAAGIVAAEWNAQGQIVQPGEMPAVRLVNSVIDGVTRSMAEVQAEVVKFAGTDLLCYRADAPDELVAIQQAAWDPVLAWARDELGARFYLAEGIMHVAQPAHALEAMDRAVTAALGQGPGAPFRLGALHVMTTLTGSALLGLATLMQAMAPAEAWAKAHVDEDFQISRWGEDAEAAERRARRWREMETAARLASAIPA